MRHECKITVLETKVFEDLQEKYLANPTSGVCPCFKKATPSYLSEHRSRTTFGNMLDGKFCSEAWDCVSRYVYAALQGGSIMHGWTNDDRIMVACCNDGTRPVIFKIERIDIAENENDEEILKRMKFKNSVDEAYTGKKE